jgi:hypothetical protein
MKSFSSLLFSSLLSALVCLLLIGVLVLPATARADACPEWAPAVEVVEKSDLESVALRVTWTISGAGAPPVACENSGGDDWGGTDHLEVHIAEGSVVAVPHGCSSSISAPAVPSASTLVASLEPNTSAVTILVHRASKEFAFTLFACEGETCSDRFYSDGSGGTGNEPISTDTDLDDQGHDCTLHEKWALTGISGETDVGDFVVGREQANAPHAFFYPASGWFPSSPDLSDYLVLYFHDTEPGGGSAPDIYYKLHNASGWPAGGFNTSSDWDTGSILVAQGDHDTGDTGDAYPDYMADHVWSMLSSDTSGNHYVTLFAGTNPRNPDYRRSHIVWIESTDEYGTDFNLSCSSGSCSADILDASASGIAIDPFVSGTDTEFVAHARHGRTGWNYIDDPWLVEGEDEPVMLFTFERPDTGDCFDTGTDDIAWADGSWSNSPGEWSWTVETDGSCPDCPVVQVGEGHDPGLIPLPDGEQKMYYKQGGSFYVVYWNDSVWEDASPITFLWGGSGSDGPSPICIGNITTLVHRSGSVVHEGMFLRLQDTLICIEKNIGWGEDCEGNPDIVGLDDGNCDGENDAAIVFAEHVN